MRKDAKKRTCQKRTQNICQIYCKEISRNEHRKRHFNKHTRTGYKYDSVKDHLQE